MTRPMSGDGSGTRRDLPGARTRLTRFRNRFVRGHRRRWMLVSLLSFWLACIILALPLAVANADANSLGSYGVTANGWAIQPDIVNDSFQNVPVADQSAPYVYVAMDSGPSAQADASYFFPGTAVNAVPNTQGVAVSVPTGVDARYPGNGSASGKVNGFNDGVATQASAGSQSAQASEGYALAQSAVASYQFAPTIPSAPSPPSVPGVPGVPALPSPPALPTVPSGATATPGSGGGTAPTATPTAPGTGASPTAVPCRRILNICLGDASPQHGGVDAAPQRAQTGQGLQPAILPDPVEQQLSAALKAAQVANPSLLSLAGGKLAATNAALPYASADISSQAETRATDAGVSVAVVTHTQHIELFQGLITFASVDSSLQAAAPGSASVRGAGTITTTVSEATIAGIPVAVDQNGVTVQDQNASAAQVQSLSDQLNAALKQAGVQVSLTRSVITTDVGMWQGAGAGVEVKADLSPSSLNPPPPANGLPATHVDFSIGQVSASIYATPPDAGTSGNAGGGGLGGGGGYCFFCGGGGGFGGGGFGGGNAGSSGSTTSTTPGSSSGQTGAFTLPGGLRGAPLLALVFVIQGLSTAAVAATAGFTDAAGVSETPAMEEETQ
jgi:hypothetical protein